MGVLDDAIRDHLELKRRHGATDEEIAQKEAEALGPARRDFPAAQAEAEAEAPPAEDAVPEVPEMPIEPPPVDPFAKETLAPTVVDEPAVEPEPEPEQALEPEPDTRHPTPDTQAEPEPESEPEPEPEEPRSDSEDVLEETPEFLQDAPEHDRLWFEQKPPRDFDFE